MLISNLPGVKAVQATVQNVSQPVQVAREKPELRWVTWENCGKNVIGRIAGKVRDQYDIDLFYQLPTGNFTKLERFKAYQKSVIPLKPPALSINLKVMEAVSTLIDRETVTRAIELPELYNAVFDQLIMQGYYLYEIYMEAGEMFGICSNWNESADGSMEGPGLMYRVGITNDGINYTLGAPEPVTTTFTPVEQMSRTEQNVMVSRDASGRRRWFAVASTSTINRDHEIDSKALFDNLEANAQVIGMPYATLIHCGKALRVGTVDLVAREGDTLVNAGYFDDTELGNGIADALEAEPEYWGTSISFMIDKPPRVERVNGVLTPVYTSGRQEEISFLPEAWAASILTSVMIERDRVMSEKLKEMLRHVFPDDEATIEKYVSQVDDVNRAISDANLVTREAAVTDPVPDPVPPEPDPQPVPPDVEYVLDDAALLMIIKKVMASPEITRASEAQESTEAEIVSLKASVAKLSDDNAKLVQRLAMVERSDAEKQKEWVQDMPRGAQRVTIRPSVVRTDTSKDKPPSEIGSLAEKSAAIFAAKGVR